LFKRSFLPASGEQPAFSLALGKDEPVRQVARRPHVNVVHEDNLMDDDPSLALADFDYQFNIWSQTRDDTALATAITLPGPNLHVHTNSRHLVQCSNATTTVTELTTSQQPLGQSAQNNRLINFTPRDNAAPAQDGTFASGNAHDDNVGPSKIAALITKAKAKITSSELGVLTSQSVSSRRAAL
jgi:hypothetical protein